MRHLRGRLSLLVPLLVCDCGARSSLEDECTSGGEERCDGVDNDCDGQVDEGIAPEVCGEDGCEVTVRCEDGVMPACVPRVPMPEACNLLDDDCDGTVDEGFGFGPLGDAIVLRTDEFDTGSCTSCRWAFDTAIAPANDGFLALWHIALSGGAERPNLYGRALDRFGHPTGAITLLRQDFMLDETPMLALEPLPDGGVPLDAIFRVGSDDVPGLLLVDSMGQTRAVTPTPATGPYHTPRTVWTGERFVSAWEEDDRLRVVVLAADGSYEREVEVDGLERPAGITLGAFVGRVGILVSRYRPPDQRDQWLIVLDAAGNVVSPAHPIDVRYANWQRLVGTSDGWLHINPNDVGAPSTRQALDTEGHPLGEPVPFPDNRHFQDSGHQDIFIPRPGRHEMLVAWQDPWGGDMHVEFLDDRGEWLRGWSGPPAPNLGPDDGSFTNPHIGFTEERVLIVWHGGAPQSAPNRVWVREFGCVP